MTSAQPDSEIATAAAEPGRAAFRRVLLKLSGEALMGDQPYGVDPARVEAIGRESRAFAGTAWRRFSLSEQETSRHLLVRD